MINLNNNKKLQSQTDEGNNYEVSQVDSGPNENETASLCYPS